MNSRVCTYDTTREGVEELINHSAIMEDAGWWVHQIVEPGFYYVVVYHLES